ncbi:MAG: hypothetical protein V6Z86_05370 [Hyphomicrobiales bacterium]
MTGIMFFDWEGRGPDLPTVGTMNYVLDPRMRITLLTYNFDLEGPTKSWVPDLSDLLSEECWEMVKTLVDSHTEVPPEIVEHVESGGLVCAWNTGFDRVVWQQVATPELGFPKIGIDQTLDAMVQGLASNLPGSLHGAGLALKLGGKSAGGKGAMMLFADCEKPMPEDRQLWIDYIVYGLRDTELLRDIFNVTRPLTLEEWREYWASERINDRGVGVDLDVCRGAVRYREEEKQFIAGECERLTDGAIPRPTMTTRINDWVYDILPHDLQDRMVKKRDEDGNPTNLTLAKDTLLMLLEDIKQHDAPPDDNVLEFLELLQHGRASSSVKFEKMLNQSCDGRLLGSYTFNGAGQTGRYCVARDTKVQTDTCEKFIIDLNIGDQVLTHEGRYRPVTGKIFKGKDHLFRITTEDGAYVTCTINHRFLTPNGWKNLREYKQGAVEKCTSTCVGLPILSIGYTPDDQAADATVSDLLPYSNGNPENGNPAPGAQTSAGGEQIPVEDGAQEPDVRGSMRIRSGDAERLRLPLEQPDTEIPAGASAGSSGDAGYSGNPEGSAGTSYRRQQTEQPPRQFGYGDDTWPCSPAQTTISEIVYMGVGEVWDIEVAGDHSYVAQGLIHHNSSRGIQIHNLPRDKLKDELKLLDMIADGCPIEDIRAFGSVNHVLSRLIRPTLIAEEGNTFIWGDWSAIEARVLPWLANTRKARQTVLVPFEEGKDLYVLNAAKIFNRDPDLMLELVQAAEERDNPSDEMLTAAKQRQAGKVAVLALGFGGSVGAYRAMARGYGLRTNNKEAKYIVDGWREANTWAKSFWYGTLNAAKKAIKNPGVYQTSGRLRYVFNSDLMGGTLLCFMPDGRPLAYPMAKLVEEENKFGKTVEAISYLNKSTRHTLWYGILVENPVQGYAASLLRDLLVRLDEHDCTVFHTHDEAGLEVPMRQQNYWVEKLGEMMEDAPAHAAGLPLKADIKSDVWYHK